jgi:hypothetical protein
MKPTIPLLLTLSIAAPAFGALTVYDDRAAWEAAVGAVYVEDFESIRSQAAP